MQIILIWQGHGEWVIYFIWGREPLTYFNWFQFGEKRPKKHSSLSCENIRSRYLLACVTRPTPLKYDMIKHAVDHTYMSCRNLMSVTIFWAIVFMLGAVVCFCCNTYQVNTGLYDEMQLYMYITQNDMLLALCRK